MQQIKENQKKNQQHYLEAQVKNRWAYTAVYVLVIRTSLDSIIKKRSQWPHLFQVSLSLGSLWNSVWENIFTCACMSLFLVLFWRRIYNDRRGRFLAEQIALQKAAQPPEGVWPPPPAR